MKKVLFATALALLGTGAVYVFGFPAGYQNGRFIAYRKICIGDLGQCSLGREFIGVASETECREIGGVSVFDFSWGRRYAACAPLNEKNLLSDEEALKIARKAVSDDLEISAGPKCLMFSGTKDRMFVAYSVARKFDSACPGDPSSAPAIPKIRVDRSDGKVFLQSADGEFRPLQQVTGQ